MATHANQITNDGSDDSSNQNASPQNPQSTITAQDRQNLEAARKRISKSCAEYNYFNPTHRTVDFESQYASSGHGLHPPEPETMKRDLQTFFEHVRALDSAGAWDVYAQAALEVRNMARDEYNGLNWESFQESITKGVLISMEHGWSIEVEDLVTLPMVADRVRQQRDTEKASTEQ